MWISEAKLLSYLNDTDGWEILRSRNKFEIWDQHTHKHLRIPLHAATHDENGVYIRWISCSDDSLTKRHHRFFTARAGSCHATDHVHFDIRVRTAVGGLAAYKGFNILYDLNQFVNVRGAAKNVSKTHKANMPDPFIFSKEKLRKHDGKYKHITMLSSCKLVGLVGLTENAKATEEIAQRPGEPVWFHFYCTSPSTATYDIITDGDVFYPLNRRSKRLTTNLNPKPTVDLNLLSEWDQELLREAINDFVGGI